MEVEKKTLSSVTVLRGIAVVLVFGFHLLPGIIPGGYVGVDVFIVVTGFLMFSYFYSPNPISISKYLTARILRLYPALTVTTLISVLLFYLSSPNIEHLNSVIKSALNALSFRSNYFLEMNWVILTYLHT